MGDEFKIELSRAKANLDSLNSGANPQIRLDSSVKKFDFLKAVKKLNEDVSTASPEPAAVETKPKVKKATAKRAHAKKAPEQGVPTDPRELIYQAVDKEVERRNEVRARLDKRTYKGMSYGTARKTIDDIIEKYHRNGTLKSIMTSITEVDENGNAVTRHIVDPEKMPEPDKTEYKKATEVINHIESQYPDEFRDAFPNLSLNDAAARGLITTKHL